MLGALGEASPVTMDIALHTHDEDPIWTGCRQVGERTTWFVWQAPDPGTATVDTRDGNYDTTLNVYRTQAPCPAIDQRRTSLRELVRQAFGMSRCADLDVEFVGSA